MELRTAASDPGNIKTLLRKYAPVKLDVSLDHLAVGDRKALSKLIEAASWIDRIYWRQRSGNAAFVEQALPSTEEENLKDLERLLRLNFGPWDTFDDDRPFWGNKRRPPGGDLYPEDLSREELEQYIAKHPEERKALESHTTLIRRKDDRLIAIPYSHAYSDELANVARNLEEASETVTNEAFRDFLRQRARDLVSGSLRTSEKLWIDAGDSPIDVAVGPYEVYDDALAGLKTCYEATVMVRHPMTRHLNELNAVTSQVGSRFPGAVVPPDSRQRILVGVYDVVYTAGMTNMGAKAIAAMLPNDEQIRAESGARLMLFRNVITAKFNPILKPLAEALFRSDQIGLVREDAFLEHTLLHELAHALSTDFVWRQGKTTEQTINEALRERYSTIDECRADLIGMVILKVLAERRILPAGMESAAAATFVANGLRSLRFGAGDNYSQASAITMSQFLKKGAVRVEGGKYVAIDTNAVHREVAELAGTVQRIATEGDYEAAGSLIDELGPMPPEIEALRQKFAGIPIDIEFVFNTSTRRL